MEALHEIPGQARNDKPHPCHPELVSGSQGASAQDSGSSPSMTSPTHVILNSFQDLMEALHEIPGQALQ